MPAIRTSNARVPALTPDVDKIKRPQNSFILYRSDKSKNLLETQLSQGVISGLIGQAWKNESPEVKMRYEREAERRKLEHTILYPQYRFAPQSQGKKKQEKQSGLSRDSSATPNMAVTGTESSQASTPSTTFSYSPSPSVYDPEQAFYGLQPSAGWFEGSIFPQVASTQFNALPGMMGVDGVVHYDYQSTETAETAHSDNMNASATSFPNFLAMPHPDNDHQNFGPFSEWSDYSKTGIKLDDYNHSEWFQNLSTSMEDAEHSTAGPSSRGTGSVMSFEDLNYDSYNLDPTIIY